MEYPEQEKLLIAAEPHLALLAAGEARTATASLPKTDRAEHCMEPYRVRSPLSLTAARR